MKRLISLFLCVCSVCIFSPLFLASSVRANVPPRAISFCDEFNAFIAPPDDPRCVWIQVRWPNTLTDSEIFAAWETPEEDGLFCTIFAMRNGSIEVCAYSRGRTLCHFLRFMYIRTHPDSANDFSGSWRRVYSVYIFREDFEGNATDKRVVVGDGLFETCFAPTLEFFPDDFFKYSIRQALAQPLLVTPP